MAQTTLSVRMDENVKRDFDAFCNEVGLNASVAVTLFAKAVLRERRIPFEIALPSNAFYSEANQKRLRESLESLRSGRVVRKSLAELEALADD